MGSVCAPKASRRAVCRPLDLPSQKAPGRGLAPNANDGGGRHAPTTRVARASAARPAPALSSAAPAERGWFSSIVASTDARWTVCRRPARANNSQPRRNMSARQEYRCGSRKERAVRYRSWRARPHRGSLSLQSKAGSTCQPIARPSMANDFCWRCVISPVLSEVAGWWPSESFGAVRTSNSACAPPD